MKSKAFSSVFLLCLSLLGLASCQADKPKDMISLPVTLQIVTEGEVYENPESSESWTIYVNMPHEEAHVLLKEQMETEGGWDARSEKTYRKTINGQTYEISITKGKIPVGDQGYDQSLRDTWTTFFLRRV
jgi:hypothetical protein